MKIIRREIELIEHEGKYYTPNELAKLLKIDGEIDIVLNEEGDTWFSRAMGELNENDE